MQINTHMIVIISISSVYKHMGMQYIESRLFKPRVAGMHIIAPHIHFVYDSTDGKSIREGDVERAFKGRMQTIFRECGCTHSCMHAQHVHCTHTQVFMNLIL